MAKPDNFKVIIAGGSLTGLTLANALERAGIDFVLLEKRQIAPDLGASIGVLCHNINVYEQLGVADLISAATVPILERLNFVNGSYFSDDSRVTKGIDSKTQRPIRFMERSLLLRTLYNNIQDKSKIHAAVGLESFEESDSGVVVIADNGERFHGSILVGADGVHSTVRQLMSKAAAATDPGRAENLMSPFTAGFRTIFSIAQNINLDTQKPFMADGVAHFSHHTGVSGLTATGQKGLIFWFLSVKEDKTTRTPDCPRYCEKDTEATMEQFGHLKAGSDYTFRDLWNSRIKATMNPLEEGVVNGPWNNGGRVVLLGDSSSKVTINLGIGGNTHVEGVCHLTNEIAELLQRSPEPRTEEITQMLNRFEEKHRPRAEFACMASNFITRYEARETWWMRLAMRVLSWVPADMAASRIVKYFAAAPLLKYPPTHKV